MTEAQKLIGQMSISGVQVKLSVRLNTLHDQLETTPHHGSYILKPSPNHLPFLAENENLFMNMAREFSIEVPPHGLLPLKDGKYAYVIRRIDRIFSKNRMIKRHMEDFAQLLERNDKYRGSIEQIGRFLIEHSSIPFIDTQKLFARVLYFFLIGNGDAHLKNFSMIRSIKNEYRLSEAYDIVSSRLVLPNEKDEMALTINGKKNNLTLSDFKNLANYLEMNNKTYAGWMNTARELDILFDHYVHASFLSDEMKARAISIFQERFQRLFPS